MEIKDYIGKVVKVKILATKNNWYLAKMLFENINVYIEEERDSFDENLVGLIEKCVILEEREGSLIGFLLSNRKFENEIRKIDKSLRQQEEYDQIKDIYLMERLKIKGKVEGLYFVDLGDKGNYYLGTTLIGTYTRKLKGNNILFRENTIENQLESQIKDVIQSIDLTKKEISLRQEQEKEKSRIEKALGLEKNEKITRIATLDLKQKVVGQQKRNEEIIKKNVEKQVAKKEKEEISNTKDVNIKQEMDTKDKVTDMKTLGKLLKDNGKLPKVEGKEFIKVGIIESNERNHLLDEKGNKAKVNTTRYSFVAIAKDGSVVPLDIQQDHTEGNNPRELNYQVSQQGKVSKDDVLSRFQLGEGTLAVKNGKYGEIKVYHSPRKTIGGKGIEGNKSLDRELETDNVWEIKKEERDLAGEYEDGYRSVEEGYQEAKSHEDDTGRIIDDDKMEIKDIDGELNTKSHVHDKVDYNALAVKWGYYREGEPNADRAKELFQEKRKENPQKETKEIIEMVTEELEEELGHERNSRY